ncbi:MAG: ATP-binding cassette domain-containing protein [Fimbriimonadaceae bacterium]|nr:ATP-binding cassette domain-containing protein [Fimbriimonadaceae bacterium]
MVRTDSISKTFSGTKGNRVEAVKSVSIQAEPGKVFGLLGVNGAGKTTLLRMLSTVLEPTAGTAEVAGFSVQKDPGKVRASIGFMSTSTALYGRLTGKELLEYFGGLYGLSNSQLKTRIDYVTDKFKLDSFIGRLCDKMSTGQKQRISVSRTILHDPPVLFFDEPTAGLDVVTSQTVMEFIEEQRTLNKTIVFSTHIMSEAERICDQISIIHDGVICGEGTVGQILESAGEQTLEKAFLKLVGADRKNEEVPA